VVGIDNTDDRIPEYTPTSDDGYGGGNGDRYADFIVHTLKPLVDYHFNTRCERESNTVVGSSLGGLISLHIYLRYPEVFGGVGAVSPSLWWDDGVMIDRFADYGGQMPHRLWLDGGTAEGTNVERPGLNSVVRNVRTLRDLALDAGMVFGRDLGALEDPNREHNEAAWEGRLPSILVFLLGETEALDQPADDLSVNIFGQSIDVATSPTSTNLSVEVVHGGDLRLTWPNTDVTLESLDPDVASVAADGTVTALSGGSAEIEAEIFDLTGTDSINVGGSGPVTVTFNVTVPASTPEGDTVYLAGNLARLGEWAADGVAMDQVDDTHWTVTLELPDGSVAEYKYTRGDWSSVEKDADGGEIANRQAEVDNELVLDDTVQAWADQ
jgi:pimeloyl-ACP methyl ester carboxylesterase